MQPPVSCTGKITVFTILTLVPFIVLSHPAVAQSGIAAAALNGTVRDPSGAVVPDATISLINSKNGLKQTTQSNSTGNYSLVHITPGEYSVSVKKSGFETATSPS